MNIQKVALIIFIFLVGVFAFKKMSGSNSDVSKETENQEIVIKGSDTEVQLVSNLAEAFSKDNSGLAISVTGGGSSVGIAAVLNGEAPLANSSRALKSEEIQQFAERGIDYKTIVVARDGLSIIVNKDNPLSQLSLGQIGQIYRGEIKDWSEISTYSGKISLYGRQSTSGTYGFFRDVAVKADYVSTMKNMEGNQAILDGVISDKLAIGYVGVGYVAGEGGQPRNDIKVIWIAGENGNEAISPLDEEAVRSGKYPLFRPIYQFVSYEPEEGSALRNFLKFEVSQAGQALVKSAGFYAITPEDEVTNAWLN